MIKNDKLLMLDSYIKSNVAPILLEGIPTDILKEDAVVIPSDVDRNELNGHYEGIDFVPPLWYQKLLSKKDQDKNILIIDEISKIPKEEQKKFIEILKYRKVSVFDLPKNCIVIITCENVNQSIHEEIYSLVVHI